MVLELDRPLNTPPSFSIIQNTLRVTISGITNDLFIPEPGEYRDEIVSLDASKASNLTRIDAVFPFDPAEVNTFSLTSPYRFIIDVYRPPAPTPTHQPPGEAPKTASIREKTASLEPSAEPEQSPLPGISQSTASTDAYRLETSHRPNTAILNRHRFEQRLIGTLIVVTSMIVVLIIMLIWIGGGRKISRKRSWRHRLPATRDTTITHIDAKIDAHFKTLTTHNATSQVSTCPDQK
jgi:hypothetical protein